jgi:hypothetical protein
MEVNTSRSYHNINTSFDLFLLFTPPFELMLLLFSIVVVVLAINDKHTLPVKYANTNNQITSRVSTLIY